MTTSAKKTVAVIAGPTASGKSAYALAMAKARNGVIINADASQLYADLQILSARPDAYELEQAEHRLYGVRDGALPCSAAQWAEMARAEIGPAHDAGKLPILVGGTGMYLNVLMNGIAPVPDIDDGIRAEVRSLSTAELAAALAAEDAGMAGRLRPSDTQRMARALEVVRSTGKSLAAWQREMEGGIGGEVDTEVYIIDLPRETLYARCDARLGHMLGAGGLEEVSALKARQLDPALPVMKAIGVPPLIAFLSGRINLEDAAAQARQDTRRYAKRQRTWFRTQGPKLGRLMAIS
ncbi:tRNA (adenosine(37)-N6)-dimethylallyltransferase MiaA [Pacificimonas sp. WHA3]|uniref:tRNA dimethylallyltransferase n=1 Tax=Pacificimonas pallii TaxID=2827236 RepID=A0ABS6SED0_9SPHN|nr:tRNA (adenosine(37)-N6)-dimethylallyltransferase MiaA [Pacificimonas pallii]MBV7256768.1 tRNA (adenosine(37)-N6)-dimethylallyltransferase MiaA [Pacificimonas pallii]